MHWIHQMLHVCSVKRNTSDCCVSSFPHTVHSRSSPAETCTPPNQKSRVKKKVSKSSAYRRDIQGGEWISVWIQGKNNVYISVFHHWHFLKFNSSVIEHTGNGSLLERGVILHECDNNTVVRCQMFSVALLQQRRSCPQLSSVTTHCSLSVGE